MGQAELPNIMKVCIDHEDAIGAARTFPAFIQWVDAFMSTLPRFERCKFIESRWELSKLLCPSMPIPLSCATSTEHTTSTPKNSGWPQDSTLRKQGVSGATVSGSSRDEQ